MKEIRAKFLDAKAFNSRIKSPDMEKKECSFSILSECLLYGCIESDDRMGRFIFDGISNHLQSH